MNDFENEAIGQANGERIPKESGEVNIGANSDETKKPHVEIRRAYPEDAPFISYPFILPSCVASCRLLSLFVEFYT